MTDDEKAHLDSAAQTVGAAVRLISRDMHVIEEFLAADDSRDSDRQAALAVVGPIFRAAKTFVEAYDLQVRSARAALTAVNTK